VVFSFLWRKVGCVWIDFFPQVKGEEVDEEDVDDHEDWPAVLVVGEVDAAFVVDAVEVKVYGE